MHSALVVSYKECDERNSSIRGLSQPHQYWVPRPVRWMCRAYVFPWWLIDWRHQGPSNGMKTDFTNRQLQLRDVSLNIILRQVNLWERLDKLRLKFHWLGHIENNQGIIIMMNSNLKKHIKDFLGNHEYLISLNW